MKPINKLWGKTRCGYTHDHQQDSDRFVWRRLQNFHNPANCGNLANCSGIQLGTYSYDAGATPFPNEDWRLSHTFSTVLQPDVTFVLGMRSLPDGTVVHSLYSRDWSLLESKTNTHTNLCTNYQEGSVQGLYFGGTCTAPEDISVVYEAVDGPPKPTTSPTRNPSLGPSLSIEPSSSPSGNGVCSAGSPDPFPGTSCATDAECGCGVEVTNRKRNRRLVTRLKSPSLLMCLDIYQSGCTERVGRRNSCCAPYQCISESGTKTCRAASTPAPTTAPIASPTHTPTKSFLPSLAPTNARPETCGCVTNIISDAPTHSPTPSGTTRNCIDPQTCTGSKCICTSNGAAQCCDGYSCKLKGGGPNGNRCV